MQPHPSELRQVGGQAFRYCLVGVTNTTISLVTYWLLLSVGVHYVAAAAAAFAAGAVNGYVLNRTWTFRARGSWHAGALYAAVQLIGLGLDAMLVWVLVDGAGLHELAGQALALVPVTVITFALSRQVVFRLPRPARRRVTATA